MVPRKDPFRNFRFRVEIDGIQKAAFSEVTGIESADEPTDYKVGNEQNSRKLPGQNKFSNITLKRGVTNSSELHDWHKENIQGCHQTQARLDHGSERRWNQWGALGNPRCLAQQISRCRRER